MTDVALRLTQVEIEAHPAWRGFAESAGKHLPLRGLLAVPIVGEDGRALRAGEAPPAPPLEAAPTFVVVETP
jgi:hypothetical protein